MKGEHLGQDGVSHRQAVPREVLEPPEPGHQAHPLDEGRGRATDVSVRTAQEQMVQVLAPSTRCVIGHHLHQLTICSSLIVCMLHFFIGRSDNAIKQRWRLINRAEARSARSAKSNSSGVAALTDQSISNDNQLKVSCTVLCILPIAWTHLSLR